MKRKCIEILHILILLLFFPVAVKADWASFRNGGNSAAASLPIRWTPESITWQHELPGYGQSTPVIHNQQVFIASVVGGMKEHCLIQCLNLETGKEAWRYKISSANKSPSNYMASRAAPTPVVDGNAVYVFFETGDLLAVDLQGKQIWRRVLSEEFGEFENNHGLGSSPAQDDSHMFLNLEHRGPSHLVAIKKSDGKTTWKVRRPSGSSWSSPILTGDQANPQLIVSSAGAVTAYDPSDGKELWAVDGLDGNSVPSPTVHGNKLFVGARLPEFAKEGSIRSNCCLDISAGAKKTPEVLWRASKAISDYASPVVAGDCVYFVNKAGVLHCLDIANGKVHYRKRLPGPCWATPVVSKSHVYFFCKNGSTQVIEAGSEYKVVVTNDLWDKASPPKPETYVEFTGGHGSHHGGHVAAAGKGDDADNAKPTTAKPEAEKPGGRMMAMLMRGDANKDGKLTGAEIPPQFRSLLARVDSNGDGELDAAELTAMARSFAERRANSQAAARDPIVYGVAASAGKLLIRTGTRLYCISK